MVFCLFRFGSRLPPHPVFGQSLMLFKVVGQDIATLPPVAWGAVRRPRPLRRCASLTALSELKTRSEEHTSELQSHLNLVCRLLLEKKKNCMPHETYFRRTSHNSR